MSINKNIKLRSLKTEDCKIISDAFKKQGWNKPVSQYENYLTYQQTGKRDVIVAEIESEFSGYLTISWEPGYAIFKNRNIPEIVDMNVLKKFQRRGIATMLMDEAERRIGQKSNFAGIGFGVTKDYGAAQRLYINRNYKPDGEGLIRNDKRLNYGDIVTIDDSLAFYLIKELK